MNILQIISRHHNRSGSGVQMMQLSLELANRGHNVTTIYRHDSANDGDFSPYENSSVTLKRVPFITTRLRLKSLSDVLMVRRLIKQGGYQDGIRYDYDVIHTHSNVVDHVFLATLGMNIPIVSNRGMSAKLNWVKGFKYRSSKIKRAIAVSKDIKRIMVKTGSVCAHKIDVIYGSVDPKRFTPELKKYSKQTEDDIDSKVINREKLGIPQDAFVFGYTGSMGGRKGIDFLLEAFKDVVREAPEQNCSLLLVGISDDQLKASGFDIQTDIAQKIVCAGFQHQPEHHMALFDTFVFPGVRDEGLTGAIREAASMKIPAISTDNGGNRELIIDQETGLMVPIRDSKALAKAMMFMLTEQAQRGSMAENAYRIVMDTMTIEKRTDTIETLYKQITGL